MAQSSAAAGVLPGVLEVSHPLIKHHLSNLRLVETSARDVRSLIAQISTLLVAEATKGFATMPVQGQGPLAGFKGESLQERIGVVPILRAGLGMTDAALSLLPDNTSVLHIGLFREKVSLQPVEYYSKLPSKPTVDRVLILDPLVATGGTAVACVRMILDWGIPISKIHFLCVLASRPGLAKLTAVYPGLEIIVGAIDPELNEKGYIVPGLGDTGDRLFDTL
ncbi:putative uracil phosphoribosyltransferase [Tilletiaria anomala UBC 951]|uniref:uracil phosphoribosyltransferase n=1 Tax=Tilletiaria anomala (strain ATCC 24038 / CBS 436.72 / UBC 951) TaxID=1037660 RepID=A0A066W9J1_TILAU|nr:putative uracil phosphoribosyltransferase [Tilletiaria anomala UBC 951]KDN50371.1 putative uracil phosphoribosyltransferase [Tilletiaria anomala UBC 951]